MLGVFPSTKPATDIFSYHLAKVPLFQVPRFLFSKHSALGLNHSESFFTMNLGEAVLNAPRYNFSTVAFFAWWKDEAFLADFLDQPANQSLRDGWHVRMKPYRKWGAVEALKGMALDSSLADPEVPLVSVTLARLKLSQVLRFVRWGKPVENQVRHHPGKNLAFAAFRPWRTFSTFSVWRNESELNSMVHGRDQSGTDQSHNLAMKERSRKDFHIEFTTLRFKPLKEFGTWNGTSGFTLSR